jgi:hypothetical protein
MAKSYESKIKAFKSTCSNMAAMITLTVKFQISQENAEEAGKAAAASARYAFHGFPELR